MAHACSFDVLAQPLAHSGPLVQPLCGFLHAWVSSALIVSTSLKSLARSLREEEERERESKREAKKAKKAGAEEANKADVPDGFMDMMGFGGFGTSKGGNKK